MLVNHVGRDGQGLVSRDGRRERRYNEFSCGTGRDRDVLMAADQTEAGGDGRDTSRVWREQPVAPDVSGRGRPRHRRGLNHGEMVVRHGVEVHSSICIGGCCAAR